MLPQHYFQMAAIVLQFPTFHSVPVRTVEHCITVRPTPLQLSLISEPRVFSRLLPMCAADHRPVLMLTRLGLINNVWLPANGRYAGELLCSCLKTIYTYCILRRFTIVF